MSSGVELRVAPPSKGHQLSEEEKIQASIQRETTEVPRWSNTLLAAVLSPLGFSIDHHVSNVASEMRIEGVWRDVPKPAAAAPHGCDQACSCLHALGAPQAGSPSAELTALNRDIGKLYMSAFIFINTSTASSEVAFAAAKQKIVTEYTSLITRYDAVRGEERAELWPPFTGKRGSMGETLVHWAALQKNFRAMHFLLRLEPMLLAAVYQRPTFRGESVLDILIAHESLPNIRELARFALFYQQLETQVPAENDICNFAWRLLGEREGTRELPRSAWMCDAWRAIVNGRADGTFFESPENGGTCYYGGTPVSIAVSLGNLPIVRFLTVEVGCTCYQCWDCCTPGNPRLNELYPSPTESTQAVPAQSCWQLRDWDVSVTARLDLPDRYGNTAAHMAIYHHSTPDLFYFLDKLYSAGFGRHDNRGRGRGHPELCRPEVHYSAEAACTMTVHRIPRLFPTDAAQKVGDRLEVEKKHINTGLEDLGLPAALTESKSFSEGEERTLTLPLTGLTETQSSDFLKAILQHKQRLEIKRDPASTQCISLPITIDTGFTASPRHITSGAPALKQGGGGQGAAAAAPAGLHDRGSTFPAPGTFATLRMASVREEESKPMYFQKTFTWVQPQVTPAPAPAAGAPMSGGGSSSGSGSGSGKAVESSDIEVILREDVSKIKTQESTGERRKLGDLVNFEGLTPLNLAVFMGKRALFDSMWRAQSYSPRGMGEPFWTWGGTSGIIFPLDQIDDIGQVQDDLSLAPSGDMLRYWWRHFLGLPLPALGTGTGLSGVALRPTGHYLYWKAPGFSTALWRLSFQMLSWWLPLPYSSPTPRQPTATDVLVSHNRWVMLEPGGDHNALAREVARTTGAATLASQALYRHHQKEELSEKAAAELYSANLKEAERLLASAKSKDSLDVSDLLASSRAAEPGAGSESRVRAGDSVLEQLAERKWERRYSVLFVRLAIFRCLAVLMAWGLLITRSGAPLNLSVCSPDYPPSWCVGGAHSMRGMVLALFAGSLAVFAVNALPYVRYRVLPLLGALGEWLLAQLRALGQGLLLVGGSKPDPAAAAAGGGFSRKHRHVVEPEDPAFPFLATLVADEEHVVRSREETLYLVAHSGNFGWYYTVTVLAGMGLLCCGSAMDLWGGGWTSSTFIVYAIGAFFSTLHLLYFLIGSNSAGPLFVMVGSTVAKQIIRWAYIYVPVLFSFAFLQFCIDSGPRAPTFSDASASGSFLNSANPAADLAASGATSFFRDILLGWVLDNSLNNFPSTSALNASHGSGDSGGRTLTMVFWIIIIYTNTIVLTSLLIAMLTDAFTAQQDRKSDFLIERLRACMLLECNMSGIERYFGVPERDRHYVLTKDRGPVAENHALRPYFMCLQPSHRSPYAAPEVHGAKAALRAAMSAPRPPQLPPTSPRQAADQPPTTPDKGRN